MEMITGDMDVLKMPVVCDDPGKGCEGLRNQREALEIVEIYKGLAHQDLVSSGAEVMFLVAMIKYLAKAIYLMKAFIFVYWFNEWYLLFGKTR